MKEILTITKREFMSFLNSPTAYVVAVAYLLPSYFIFWQTTLFNGEATMRNFFDLWPWFLMLLAPALTMRALSEEKRKQTLDLLLVHPVKEYQVVVGKFLGAWGFLTVLLAITLTLPLTVGGLSSFDYGQAASGYLGAWLAGGVAIAIGIFVSAWTTNVISSFLVSSGLILAWILVGLDFVLVSVPPTMGNILSQISVLTHMSQFNRGLVLLRDIVFFVVMGTLVLGLSSIKLMEVKTYENKNKRRSLYIGALVFALIGIFLNQILDSWSGRLDWSKGQLYSLSEGTRTTLSSLDDVLNITYYTSRQLPAGQTQLTARYTQDLLDDYVRFGNGKVKLSTVYPESDPSLAQKAAKDGVRQVNFNSVSTGKLEVQAGYLGVSMAYGGKNEAIEYVSDPGNLEYEMTRRIRKLNRTEPKTLGVVSGSGEKTQYSDYATWAKSLESEYKMENVDFSTPLAKDKYAALLIVGPSEEINATVSAGLKNYLNNGGDAMFLIDKIQPNYQLGIGSVLKTGVDDILKPYGVEIANNLVFDVENNEPVPLENGPIRYLIPYPFWINSLVNKEFSPIAGVGSVTLGWASEVNITPVEASTSIALLKTGKDGGSISDTFSIQPESTPKLGMGKEYTLAAAVEKSGSKVVVIGDSDLAVDMFTEYKSANLAFLSNLVDWLSLGNGEQIVSRKDFSPAILQVKTAEQLITAQYGNIVGVPLVLAIFGIYWLRRRKQRSMRKFKHEQ